MNNLTKIFILLSLALLIALFYTFFFITIERQAEVYKAQDTLIVLHKLEHR